MNVEWVKSTFVTFVSMRVYIYLVCVYVCIAMEKPAPCNLPTIYYDPHPARGGLTQTALLCIYVYKQIPKDAGETFNMQNVHESNWQSICRRHHHLFSHFRLVERGFWVRASKTIILKWRVLCILFARVWVVWLCVWMVRWVCMCVRRKSPPSFPSVCAQRPRRTHCPKRRNANYNSIS